jgi:hypothetical protein
MCTAKDTATNSDIANIGDTAIAVAATLHTLPLPLIVPVQVLTTLLLPLHALSLTLQVLLLTLSLHCVALPTNVRLPLKSLTGTTNIVNSLPATVPKKTNVFKYLGSA